MFRNYVIGMIWFAIFWIGINFLVGVGVGAVAGMDAPSVRDGVMKGGIAGAKFTKDHDRLIMFISGFLVTWAMTRGLLPGSPNRKQRLAAAHATELHEHARRLRDEAVDRLDRILLAANKKKPVPYYKKKSKA